MLPHPLDSAVITHLIEFGALYGALPARPAVCAAQFPKLTVELGAVRNDRFRPVRGRRGHAKGVEDMLLHELQIGLPGRSLDGSAEQYVTVCGVVIRRTARMEKAIAAEDRQAIGN